MATAELTSLLRSTHITSHEDVLKAANASLKKSKTDPTAQRARIVALLKLDRYDDAVRAFEEAGAQGIKDAARLEYAYALYKAGQLERAEEVAASGAGDGGSRGGVGASERRGLKHVLAQTTYRLEKFEKAAALYAQLDDGSPGARAEANDLRINGAAVDAQLEWQGKGHLVKKKQPTREDLEAFESAYNAACGAIARGELAKGEMLLRRARDLCLASEELSEEEKKVEMIPIVAQMAYVLLRLGRIEEAKKLSAELDEQDNDDQDTDKATKWIAKVNGLVASTYGEEAPNPFLTHRIYNSGPKLEGSDLPFTFQADLLRQNAMVVDLLSSKYAGVIRSTSRVGGEPTTSPAQNTLSVLNAAAHAKGQSPKAALKAVLPLLEQRPKDVGLLLTVVHLYMLTNNHGSAISLLESFFARLEASKTAADLDVRYAPGLVAVLVSLYAKQNRAAGIKAELSRAASYWRARRKEDASIPLPVTLLRSAGKALLEASGEHDEDDIQLAVDVFTDLHEHDPDDRASTAGLVAALARRAHDGNGDGDGVGSAVPASLLDSLTPSARLVGDIDAEALENAGVPSPLSPLSSAAATRKRAAAARPAASRKRARLSKKRMPKDFVEGKVMDKERWLPLRDRSYWRPKGKGKGKKKGQDLTQGGAVEEPKAAAPAQQSAGGAAGGGKNKGKKKKR
ncbi:uncharacterized protein PV09_06237 [Verruconis gallopava]|uniref:Signal recognition particle subunit SRP72 n=1 Tax=Verruconis gallopava TaxID=253628 RepID=A0A0D2ATF0_9PEZI|nr:uncharacterized protein PV09_06237 [Verruconis gallopava]KIW02419.1 hypothetical protein PV09_06237 [Verruconis gallopava]